MKHCGLPFEFGLLEVHQALLENNLRNQVTLRTDGGLHTGLDIIISALLGADEYDFGKLIYTNQVKDKIDIEEGIVIVFPSTVFSD
jgi:glutamate synthase domain-containing protein 2